MPLINNAAALFEGFSKLDREDRFQRLLDLGALSQEDIVFLKAGGIQDTLLAEELIENVIGYFQLPLGVATNFCIDGKDHVIPLAVEETSIIAALSKTAKWIRQEGYIETSVQGNCILGQIQIAKVADFERFAAIFAANKTSLIEQANREVASNMVRRGGGVMDLQLRELPRTDGYSMAVIHLTMNSCDAMGANIINQVLEFLKHPLERLVCEQVSMCILSNLNDQKLTTAKVTVHNVEPDLGERIQEASLFAETDPYRAATHNKGVMNGIDPVLIATGNDWRAVEAGVHAYAARSGQYRAITQWRYTNGTLVGTVILPLVVGTVGGVTSLHPMAKMNLRMMGVESANHLSRILAAVGLVQNLGALRALCTEGIIQGHMKLHLDNLVLVAGAKHHEKPRLKARLEHCLSSSKRVSASNANQLLEEMRQEQTKMCWRIPAKTFLLGEYAALSGASAMLLATEPSFELKVADCPGLQGMNAESPAARYWKEHGEKAIGLVWDDPYRGCGGLGASSAQFIGVYFANCYFSERRVKISHLLACYYQYAWNGKGIRPSGYDVIAQLHQGCVFYNHSQATLQTYPWPFDDLAFILLHTGKKLATHQHLQDLMHAGHVAQFEHIVQSARVAIETQDSERFVKAIAAYHHQLELRGLVAAYTLEQINQFNEQPDILAAKGCGAMGADVILVLTSQSKLHSVLKYVSTKRWAVIATSKNLYHGSGLLENNYKKTLEISA